MAKPRLVAGKRYNIQIGWKRGSILSGSVSRPEVDTVEGAPVEGMKKGI